MQQGWFYDFSNYGVYERLTNDGMTQWHPAFLNLGNTLEECAAKYRKFCQKYKPQPKPEKKSHWGSKFLAGMKIRGKPKKRTPGQQRLPWAEWEATNPEIQNVAKTFVLANALNPEIEAAQFEQDCSGDQKTINPEEGRSRSLDLRGFENLGGLG